MNPIILIKLSENDKRVLIALLFLVILVFVIIGLIGSLIVRIMKWQAKKIDILTSDVVTNHIITKPSKYRSYAKKKNIRCFIKQSWIPLLLVIASVLIIIIKDAIAKDFSYNPFNMNDGFGTLLFTWDFNNPDNFTKVFGLTILAKWPGLSNEPHFVVEAIASYIAVPLFITGIVWYFIAAQAFLARTIRAYRLSKTIFEKSLEGFNQNTTINQNENQFEEKK